MELVVLEVSQKQAYIFGSKQLIENVRRSKQIRDVTETEFFQRAYPDYDAECNLVYTGGGHAVLQFESKEEAVSFVKAVTWRAYVEYDGMELFAKTASYDSGKTPGENLTELMQGLEAKKSLRLSAFHRKSLGLEEIRPEPESNYGKNELEEPYRKLHPRKMEDLLGEDNFYAVIHIDGNQMGKRSQQVTEHAKGTWEQCRILHQAFSQEVDFAFQTALQKTVALVEQWQMDGLLKESLGFDGDSSYHPIRPLIAAGDDICFLTPAALGLECAAAFLRFLASPERDAVTPFSACAGVAIAHGKYPFHRSYELSEVLCSSSKRYSARLAEQETEGPGVSAMDWHMEYGQAKSSLSEIRKDYLAFDSGSGAMEDPVRTISLRPLVVTGTQACPPARTYDYLKRMVDRMQNQHLPRSKVKGLRAVLKQDEGSIWHYLRFNQMLELSKWGGDAETDDPVRKTALRGGRTKQISLLERERTPDGEDRFVQRGLYFDAIELMDHMLIPDSAKGGPSE